MSIPHIDSGRGHIVLRRHGSAAIFSELSSTYPVKLLSPRIDQEGVAVVYLMTYGGGLVGGDYVELAIDVGPSSVLVLLSQGSTKVFKARPGNRAARPQWSELSQVPKVTTQIINVVVSEKGALVLLPDPVTCFRSASYKQVQTFRLSRGASLVALDWITSGRMALGEEWAFSRYYSANHVWADGKPIAKDVMLLEEQEETDTRPLPRRTLFDKLSPYSCYASLILYGPMAENIIREMSEKYNSITIFNSTVKPALIWSLSPISDGEGCVVRVAGKESERVKEWLANALCGLQDAIGVDVFRRAFV